MLFGIISDTHGFFDTALPELFTGVDEILHAGDIGKGMVLEKLGAIAPVVAIRGNIDEKLPTRSLPEKLEIEREGVPIFLTHDAGNKKSRPAGIAARMAHQPAGIILSGHSHRAVMEVQGAWLFLNPGSAGKKRFKLERTAGLLRLSREIARVEIYSLEGPKPKLYAEGDFPLARA